MAKCDVCGKEVLFPFKCLYCHKVFCSEHRIPENHQCKDLPKERIPFSAPKYREPTVTQERTPWKDPRIGRCPQCKRYTDKMGDYDAKTMTFECQFCGHKWIQLKGEPYDIVEPKEESEKPKKKQ